MLLFYKENVYSFFIIETEEQVFCKRKNILKYFLKEYVFIFQIYFLIVEICLFPRPNKTNQIDILDK